MKIPTIYYISSYEIPNLISKDSSEWQKTVEELKGRGDAFSNMMQAIHLFKNNEDFYEGYIRGACITYSLLKAVVKPIPEITMDNLYSAIASLEHDRQNKNKEVYTRMYDEQPIFLEITSHVVDSNHFSGHFKDGFCKAMAQFYDLIWRALEAKELEEMFA